MRHRKNDHNVFRGTHCTAAYKSSCTIECTRSPKLFDKLLCSLRIHYTALRAAIINSDFCETHFRSCFQNFWQRQTFLVVFKLLLLWQKYLYFSVLHLFSIHSSILLFIINFSECLMFVFLSRISLKYQKTRLFIF